MDNLSGLIITEKIKGVEQCIQCKKVGKNKATYFLWYALETVEGYAGGSLWRVEGEQGGNSL